MPSRGTCCENDDEEFIKGVADLSRDFAATCRELRDLSSGSQSAFSMSPLVAFSRDSRFVAAAAGDNSVKIWDVTTGRETQTLSGSQGSFLSAAGTSFIAFGADSRTLVT